MKQKEGRTEAGEMVNYKTVVVKQFSGSETKRMIEGRKVRIE